MSTPTTSKRDDSLSYVHTARAALRSTSSKYLSAPEPPTSPPPVGPPPTPPPPPAGVSGTTSPPTARLPTASNYRQSRQSELAALRQKGLAKIFNKHFTTASVQIAQERAAADAALSQIESRKAALKAQGRTHEVGEGGVSLSVLDSMYMDLQKRRDDVKKKERETMLLYRSYVSKFGSDDVNPSAAAMLQRRPSQPGVSAGGAGAGGVGRSGVSAPLTPGYQDQPHVKQSDIKTSQSREIENLTNSPGGVTSHTNRIESTVQNYNSTERMPSIATVGVDETLSHLREGEVVQGKLLERRQLEQAGIDAKASPSPAKNKKVWDGGKLSSFGSPPPLNEEDEVIEDEKRRQVGAEYSVPLSPPAERQSRTSGQVVVPDVKSKMKPVPTQSTDEQAAGGDKWAGKVGANVVITDNNMPNDDLESSFASELTSSFASLGNTPIKRNKDTEDSTFPTYDLTTTLESEGLEDDDVLSTVSGLTSISQNASDAELRLADFLRNETETIRKMLQEDLDIDNRSAVTESSRASKTSRASAESKRAAKAAAQAEEMAKLMEEAVAWANDAVEHAGSAPKAPSGNTATKGREVASDGKETWVAYWSDEHQREYYHEVNTNRVEWIMPDKFVDTAKLRRKAELGVNESGGVKKDEEEERDDDEYSVEVVDYTKRKSGGVSVASSVRSVGSYETGASSAAPQKASRSGSRGMSLSRQRSGGSVASVGGRSVTSSASVYSHEDFTPGDMVQRRSKAREYRKQRKRRQRMRRRMMAVVSAVIGLVGGGYYYKYHYDGESLDLGGFDFGSIFGGGGDETLEEVNVQKQQRRGGGSVGTKKKETEPTKKKKPTTTQTQPSKVKPSGGGGGKVEGEQKARVTKPSSSGSGVKTTATTTDVEKKQVKKKKKKKKKTTSTPPTEESGASTKQTITAEKKVKSTPSTSSGDDASTGTKTPTSSTVGAKVSTTTPGKTDTTTETAKDAAKEAEAGGMTSMIWWSGGATDDSSPPASTDNKGAVAKTTAPSSSSSSSAVATSTVSRPVGCYVPLAYVISGECRRKATEKPLFDLQSLSDSMMQ